MDNNLKTDVLIVGAGPTGLTMATQLIRYGVDFVVVDKKEGPTDLSKALVVHARSLEIFDQLGLADKAVANGEIVKTATLLNGGEVSAKIDFGRFGEGLSPFPFALIHEQSKTERLLYNYLRQNGQDIRWQTTLSDLKQDKTGARAVLTSANGGTQTVDARYVVGADGASSPVRHLLDLGFTGTTYPRLFYVADVDMEMAGGRGTLYVTFRDGSFMLMAPLAGDKRWRLIGNLPEHDGQPDRETNYEDIEAKAKHLAQRPLHITQVHWFSTYNVHTRYAETFGVGRCFLAGDAAHVHTPAGGQGMNTGIQDAYNLAWKLAFVLKGWASHALLNTYNEERLANAIHLLKTTDEFFSVVVDEAWYVRFLRNNVMPGVAGFLSRFDMV